MGKIQETELIVYGQMLLENQKTRNCFTGKRKNNLLEPQVRYILHTSA